MIDVVNVIEVYDLHTGKYLFDVDTPIGTISSISGRIQDQEFFFKLTTFLSPGIIYHYDFSVEPNTVHVMLLVYILLFSSFYFLLKFCI